MDIWHIRLRSRVRIGHSNLGISYHRCKTLFGFSSLATIEHRAALLFYIGRIGGVDDFVEISMHYGRPQMRFSVGGSSAATVWLDDWPENRIDDGDWHHIRIDYFNRVCGNSVNRSKYLF